MRRSSSGTKAEYKTLADEIDGELPPVRGGLHRRQKLLRIPAVGEVPVVIFSQ